MDHEAGPDAPTYDTIGRAYSRHRRTEPRIGAEIDRALGVAATVLDVGSGTGSYEPAGRRVVALEPSEVMIAQRPPGSAPVLRATAEQVPCADGSFDAAMAVLTLHHWADPVAGLREMCRVARRIVVLTFDPDVHRSFWLLTEYLPEVNELTAADFPGPAAVAGIVGATQVETVPVPFDCADGFNWAYWRRPRAYLDPEVRACISGIALLPPALVAQRMARLREDIVDGTWETRHSDLLDRESVDGGFRLVVRHGT